MKVEKIKPIPKYILEKIKRLDKISNPTPNPFRRFYSYLTKNDKELVKVTVAVKEHKGKWYCKQVAVHGLDSNHCYSKDLNFFFVGGYTVGWAEEGLYRYAKWWEDGRWYEYKDKELDPYAPLVNKNYLNKFPEFKYSCFELYNGGNILNFLRLYRKYPQIEYLLKTGFHYLATSKMILQQMKKDKNFHKWLVAHKTKILYGGYFIESILESYKTNMSLDDAQEFIAKKKPFLFDKHYKETKQLIKGQELKKFFAYVSNQNIKYSSYNDYVIACQYLGLDMSLDKNRYPHDFNYWHDIRIDQYATEQANADKKARKTLYDKFANTVKKYLPLSNFENEDFIVVIANSPAELIREGKILHHCVGKMNYDQKVIKQQSLIFFVRQKNEPDKPFVTVEYSLENKKIIQSHGKDNRCPNLQVSNFIEKQWLPFANKQIKQIQKAA